MMVLICHVILPEYVINWSYDFMERIPSRVSCDLANFGGHKHCGNRDMILGRHVILPVIL